MALMKGRAGKKRIRCFTEPGRGADGRSLQKKRLQAPCCGAPHRLSERRYYVGKDEFAVRLVVHLVNFAQTAVAAARVRGAGQMAGLCPSSLEPRQS